MCFESRVAWAKGNGKDRIAKASVVQMDKSWSSRSVEMRFCRAVSLNFELEHGPGSDKL